MSEYESLRKDFEQVFAAINDYAAANRRHAEAVTAEIAALWADNAELRDELHALANRVETLTRARLTEPAEVAEAIRRGNAKPEVATVQPYPLCGCGHRYDHHRHHGQYGCYESGCECRGYHAIGIGAA